MVISNRGAGIGWGGALDDEIHKLIQLFTELGIEAEDILTNGVTALLGEGTHGALMAQRARAECEARYQQAHQRALELIMDERATAEQTRWITELEQIGQTFRYVAQEAARIAANSLVLQLPVEDILLLVGAEITLLEFLVEHSRLQVRSLIKYTSSRDRKYARAILDEATDLQRGYNVLESRVLAAIRERPLSSFPMQQLLGIATWLENIDKDCHRIATVVLYDPPSQH